MNTQRISCSYCGESIAIGARKYRFCGEWLSESTPVPVNPPVLSQENQNIELVQSVVPSVLNRELPGSLLFC